MGAPFLQALLQWITFLPFISQIFLLNIKDVEFDFRMGCSINHRCSINHFLCTGAESINHFLCTGAVSINHFLCTGDVSINHFLCTGDVSFNHFLCVGAVAVLETLLEAQQMAVDEHNVEFPFNLWVCK